MNGTEKQAAFYRGHLTDQRSLIPLAIILVEAVALWLFIYLVGVVADAAQDAVAGRVASARFILDRPVAGSVIRGGAAHRRFPALMGDKEKPTHRVAL
jgi:hypothetical protein